MVHFGCFGEGATRDAEKAEVGHWWLELQGYQSLIADLTKGNQWLVSPDHKA